MNDCQNRSKGAVIINCGWRGDGVGGGAGWRNFQEI